MSARDAPGAEYGVLGVGEIGAAIVTGLCEAVEHPPQILLSPRNARRAAALAARYPSVSVAQDNQAVIDRCAALVLAIRPQDTPTILTGLQFQSDPPIISVIAGMSLNELAPLIAPAAQVARAIPLPQVARRTGVTPIHPDVAAARTLFDQLGGAITINEPDAFEAMSATTGTIAAHFAYVAAISRWLSSQGVAADAASRYVASIFAGIADTLSPDDLDLDALVQAHATPGGINERFAAILDDAGAFELVGRSLDTIVAGLRSQPPGAGR